MSREGSQPGSSHTPRSMLLEDVMSEASTPSVAELLDRECDRVVRAWIRTTDLLNVPRRAGTTAGVAEALRVAF